MVLRNAVVTRHFFATRMRSWLRISFDTAAAISGVIPRDDLASTSVLAASDSNQSRSAPTVSEDIASKASMSWLSMIRRVTSSSSYGMTVSSRNCFSGTSASAILAAVSYTHLRAHETDSYLV